MSSSPWEPSGVDPAATPIAPGSLVPLAPQAAPAARRHAPGACGYCGAALDANYYFCLACATPYASIEAVVSQARPRELTDGELVQRKAPAVRTLFFTYLSVVLGVLGLSLMAFQDDRPDLILLVADLAMFVTTCVFAVIYWRSLTVQLRQLGFLRWEAWAGLAALAPLLLVNYGIQYAAERMGLPGHDMFERMRAAGVSEAALVFSICVLPALTEEIAFRGLAQHWLQTAIAPWKANVLAAALFTALHLNLLTAPYLFALGLLLGWTKQRTGSLYPAILIHFLHNFIVIEWF